MIIELMCTPNLDLGELEFRGFKAQSGGDTVEPFIGKIGTILPMGVQTLGSELSIETLNGAVICGLAGPGKD